MIIIFIFMPRTLRTPSSTDALDERLDEEPFIFRRRASNDRFRRRSRARPLLQLELRLQRASRMSADYYARSNVRVCESALPKCKKAGQ